MIDEAVTLTGSYNWTRGTAANSENLNLVSSQAIAVAYAAHCRNRFAVSVPYGRREDWCSPKRASRACPRRRRARG